MVIVEVKLQNFCLTNLILKFNNLCEDKKKKKN